MKKYTIDLTVNGKQGVWLTQTHTTLIAEFKTRKQAKQFLKQYEPIQSKGTAHEPSRPAPR